MARRKEAHGGGHGWFVTFADLMGLLVSFFVMLVAFSNQDAKQMEAVAGSMREAFGVQQSARYSGIVESDGLPSRKKIKNVAIIPPEEFIRYADAGPEGDRLQGQSRLRLSCGLAASGAGRDAGTHRGLQTNHARGQQGRPNIEIVDQDGRAMFPDGAKAAV